MAILANLKRNAPSIEVKICENYRERKARIQATKASPLNDLALHDKMSERDEEA